LSHDALNRMNPGAAFAVKLENIQLKSIISLHFCDSLYVLEIDIRQSFFVSIVQQVNYLYLTTG
jgi:hypothetical protein